LSVLALPYDRDDLEAARVGDASRFVPMVLDNEWTVWDAERRRYLIHDKPWDAEAAYYVAEQLAVNTDIQIGIWGWSDPVDVGDGFLPADLRLAQ
jgi:hypothetical protein